MFLKVHCAASRYLKQCHFSRKKAFPTILYKHSKENVEQFCENYMSSPNIVCIDEAGFYVGDHCKYGYSKIGARLTTKSMSNLRRVKFTLLLDISSEGIVDYQSTWVLPQSFSCTALRKGTAASALVGIAGSRSSLWR